MQHDHLQVLDVFSFTNILSQVADCYDRLISVHGWTSNSKYLCYKMLKENIPSVGNLYIFYRYS